MRGRSNAGCLVALAWLAACSSAPPAPSPRPAAPVDEPPVVAPDAPRSEETVLEALWARERRIAELEAEVARLRAALEAALGKR